MNDRDWFAQVFKAMVAAGLDPEVEAGRKPPHDDFHTSIGLWQQAPGEWEEA